MTDENKLRHGKRQVNMVLDPALFEEFKKKVKKEGFKINFVIENLMKFYIENDFEFHIKSSISLKNKN